jgi:iron complex transport system permease protein
VRLVVVEFGLVNGLAFVGALLAVWVVYRLSRTSGMSPLTSLLLTGYAVGSLLAAGLALAMYASGAHLRQIFSFLLGGLDGASWSRLGGAAILIGLAVAAALARTRSLNGFILGEETAAHLGVDVPRERAGLFAVGALATAAAVAVAGLIGFVGLVVPHVVRLVVGPNARAVLPLAALGGALLLVVADLVSRLAGEIPIGVVTALIGAPFFIVILRRARTGYEL